MADQKTEHKSFAPVESLARDARPRLVDRAQIVRMAVAFEHQTAAAKRVCDQAIRARLDIVVLDFQDAFRVREIPSLAAIAIGKTSEHELRAHRAVANEPAFPQCFQKCFFHNSPSGGKNSQRHRMELFPKPWRFVHMRHAQTHGETYGPITLEQLAMRISVTGRL